MSLITCKTFLDLKPDASVRIYNNQSDGHWEFDISFQSVQWTSIFLRTKMKPYCLGYFNFSLNSEKRDLLRFRITAIF